jgi:hypothetical protein
MRSSLFSLLFLLLGLPRASGPMAAQYTGIESRMIASNVSTGKLSPAAAKRVQLAFNSASASLETMKRSNAALSAGFVDSVNDAVTVLNGTASRLNAGEKLQQADVDRIAYASADLQIKADWFKQNEPRDPVVSVTVNTKDKDGKAQPGCEVWYVTAFYNGIENRAVKFDQLSTPTSQPLMVGAYLMWTAREAKRGEPRPVRVGDNRVTQMLVDLPAPQ